MGRPDPQSVPKGLAARLAGAPSGGAGWLRAARETARARLVAMGLPARRDEYWRFTDPGLLAGEAVAVAPAADEGAALAGIDALRLVFTDGRFDRAASDDPAGAGVEISLLSEAGGQEGHWAQDLYGRLEAHGQTPVARPLAALVTAAAGEGVLIRVRARAPQPVALVYRRSAGATDALLHHVVRLEAGAALVLVEAGAGGARVTTVTEVEVGPGASLHHLRLQGPEEERAAAAHLFVRAAERAEVRSFTLTANGRMTRNETFVELAGRGGLAHVATVAMGEGAFHQDDTVFLRHAAEGCESRQVIKKVLRRGAVGVFQGKIHVLPEAQKTDGYQISQALLLDDGAEFRAKPELEIYADDVKCSHGSTAGAVDPAALFYLRARGIPLAEARALLVLAFLADALDEIAEEGLRQRVGVLLEDWVARHPG